MGTEKLWSTEASIPRTELGVSCLCICLLRSTPETLCINLCLSSLSLWLLPALEYVAYDVRARLIMEATKTFTVNKADLTNLTNKTILITGGSSGIGLATALLLHSLSNNIVVVDRSAPAQTRQTNLLISSPRFFLQQCDITSWTAQRSAFQAAVDKFGSIDAVYVNAGIAEHRDQFFKDELDADGQLAEPDRRTIDIDLHAADDTVKLAIYWMRKDAKHGKGRGGSIVMTASLAGYLASSGAPLYSAAKHGIVGLMRALKNDTATLDIAISVIAPGITKTPILSQERKDLQPQNIDEWAARMQKLGVPINRAETIALAVAHLIMKGMAGNGQGILIQADQMAEIEGGIAMARSLWMGEEMLRLFRGGRNAPLFPNKL
jgi:NAD(P)-dependent dehydrogenase (short-subunit alcohol dehydrogenase family)